MTRHPVKVPLCGTCENGYRYDESGPEPVVTRCPCRTPRTTGESERGAAIDGTAEANPQAMKAALAIIRDKALTMPVFSSNDTRAEMRIAQVPGNVVGAAFQQAAKDRVIRGDSYLPSTDPGTHAHPVRSWSSLIYTGRRSA